MRDVTTATNRAGLACLLLAGQILAAADASKDAAALLARAFKTGDEALVELSADGQWILTRGSRKVRCGDGTSGCRVDRLAIYDIRSGSQVGELLSKPAANGSAGFGPAGFVRGRLVSAVEYDGWDARAGDVAQNVLEWDPLTGTQSRLPLPPRGEFWPVCPIEPGKFLGLNTPQGRRRGAQSNCTAWRSGGFLLLEQRPLGETLVWATSAPDGPPRTCRTFPGERIHGYAISPNGLLIAAVTTLRSKPLNGLMLADDRAFVNILEGDGCVPVKRLELSFPDDPRPSLYARDFAKHVAISPDLSKIAVAYGVRYRSDGLAFFGVYALGDGRRLATFRGDVYRGGYWLSRRTLDVASASMAPLEGGVEFSADSRALFATSKYLRQWDVSGLR